jgi:cell division protein FtsB
MRIFKYLFAVWTAILVYTILSFVGGPRGLSAYNFLLTEREHQWANIKELGNINEELEKTRNNLLYDQDTLIVQARQMGYAQEDERFVRIVGLTAVNPTLAVTGKIYNVQNPEFISDVSIKIAALSLALLVFAFLLMLELIDRREN